MKKEREAFLEYHRRNAASAYRRAQNPITWEPGEQEALIAKTLAEGKITKCQTGVYTQSTFNPFVGGIMETTIDRMLPERRTNMRERAGREY